MSVTHSWFGPFANEDAGRRDLRPSARRASRAASASQSRPCDPGALHQHRDRVVTDPDAAAEHELGVHPVGAVGCRTRPRGPRGSDRSATRAGPLALTAAGTARRRSRRTTPRAPGRRPRPATPRPPSLRSPRSAFWAHRLLQQLRRPPMHRQLGLELADPPPRRPQLLPLLRAQPRQLTAIDQLLPPPGCRSTDR